MGVPKVDDEIEALVATLDRAIEGIAAATDPATSDVRDRLLEARRGAERIRNRSANAARPAPTAVAAQAPRKFRILIVDDEIAIGTSLARTLKSYDVSALDNAKDALARFRAGERYDLVLCDLLMPEMSGIELYEETMRLAPDLAQNFVFVTGGAVTSHARDFVASVPNVVLAKPFDVNKLRELIRHKEGLLQRSDRVAMVVDDDEATRKIIIRWLEGARFSCVERGASRAAFDELVASPDSVDVVLLDVMMPDLDGFQIVTQLKASPATAHIPIILLTAQAVGETEIARGVDAGAVFYLTKPFSGPVLVSKVRAACERADVEREVRTRLHLAEEHATRDALTGIMNRRGFEGRISETTSNTTRHHEPLALVMLDLDHFKRINDTFGHAGGDLMLLYFARALRRAIRVGDQAFRYGGEEFALLLPKCDAAGAVRVVTRIQQDLRGRPVALVEGGSEIVRFSAGIATAEAKNSYRVDDLVIRADAALYTAKNTGRDRIEVS